MYLLRIEKITKYLVIPTFSFVIPAKAGIQSKSICIFLIVLLLVPASLPAADLSFYKGPESDSTLVNIKGGKVRNIILCIGDGMGANHIALARNQTLGQDKKLHLERLPVLGLVRTHSADAAVTDSAASATAMACGIKTNNGMLSVAPDGTAYRTILEILDKKGWRIGLVATSTITHATPAAFAAHMPSRSQQQQIARQMLDCRVDILLGGGRKYWLPEGYGSGVRTDGQNLLAQAQAGGWQIIETKQQLNNLPPGPAIGLFANDALTTIEPEPSLSEMAAAAIKLLSSTSKDWFAPEPKFFVMIEGSQIDQAAHANDAERCIRQTLLFDMAVKEALDFASMDKHTLLIVTADHETGGLALTAGKKDQKIAAYWTSKGHTAAEVPLFAFGPGSENFSGSFDNTEIPRKIAALLGLAEFPKQLEEKTAEEKSPHPASRGG